ncbi:MAG: hypothetical protein OEN55_10240 [Alphaproteobacteria bacterium]|nr:hypothetical protein [Alphaproteobacteria bacterium]
MNATRNLALAAACAWLFGVLPAHGQETLDFMPKGGKALLIEMLGRPLDAAALRPIATARRSEEEWLAFLAARKSPVSERELRTLAGYLAVNMPVAKDTLNAAENKGDPGAALPPDGRELAWNQCQFCHSLFTSHLTQDRDMEGWLGTFQSPFHREIKMSERERETFARYSAVNMPMKIEDVPEDLRF